MGLEGGGACMLCSVLLGKHPALDGGWGDSYLSCQDKVGCYCLFVGRVRQGRSVVCILCCWRLGRGVVQLPRQCKQQLAV